uniref:Dual adapter for phosphotyrosine and 3-phosphotyrosine and 3-phosphoinositide-like n=1 Tax=Sinocyclocheilus grahami TaxID=75366 RepID=A0A672KJH4_SINGR
MLTVNGYTTWLGVQLPHSVSLCSWYHYDLSRHAAEALLLSNGVDGNFLLRNSNKGPDWFALSVRAKDSVKHFHVRRQFGKYSFGFNEFPSLQDFCSHFLYLQWKNHPFMRRCVCIRPCRQAGMKTTWLKLSLCCQQLGTKEGYLVKQGAIIKNWKQRWFTLNRYELKYFKDKMFVEPIRTLDLTECSAVQFDYSQERVNCFCYKSKTLYCCARLVILLFLHLKLLQLANHEMIGYFWQLRMSWYICSIQVSDSLQLLCTLNQQYNLQSMNQNSHCLCTK